MATRSRSVWRPNARGYYERQIGWTRTKAGKVQQPKFLLGKDLKEAQRRERKIRELWEQFEEKQQDKRPQWPVGLLAVAKKVAKGITKIEVPRKQDELLTTYADRIRRVQEQFPVVAYMPADPHAFEVGMEALQVLDSIPGPNDPGMISARATDDDVMRTWRAAEAMLDQIDLGPKSGRVDFTKPTSSPKPESGSTTISRGTNVSGGDSRSAATTGKRTGSPGTTLYAALRAYRRWIGCCCCSG